MENVKKFLHGNGFVATLTGRRRLLPDFNSAEEQKRLYAERQAVNSVIQGTASDLMKIAMALLRRMFMYGEPCPPPEVVDVRVLQGASLVLQIHDELIVECSGDREVVQAYATPLCDVGCVRTYPGVISVVAELDAVSSGVWKS